MDSDSIRREFLGFFEQRDHTVVPSSSLIPVDPTLLLTNAGMVQFKPYLLGDEVPPYLRAASVQKCFRTEDIDVVGTTTYHFTFFEMLGNFSFGDYFKERAIPLAYEFVTERLNLEPDRLWYTVHDTDDEAEQIWIDQVGVPADRVQRGGQDNFWQMGVAGPCGPSSEIFVDLGADKGEGGGPIGGSPDRFVEIWNLVFMQNIQDEPYHVVGDLPARNIDTGAGLERLAMVLQDVPSAFETDVVRPIIAAGERATGVVLGSSHQADVSLRILADHARAMAFLIGDGVVPSNQGRGYVLRRILRRAVRHAWSLGAEEVVTPSLVAGTIEVMRAAYPNLAAQADFVSETAEREEWAFRRTLSTGTSLLEDELKQLKDDAPLSGDTAFQLHDTYGFPIELTTELVTERGKVVDLDRFGALMTEQQQRARAAWKGGDASDQAGEYRSLLGDVEPSEFLGYDLDQATGRILSLVMNGSLAERVEEGQVVEVFMDRTPFYAESGGQVGDIGTISTETGTLTVTDTQFPLAGVEGHRAKVISGWVGVGQDATANVDTARRERISKSHTGTHVLHWALREVLGHHVQQAGSLVESGRFRFDFSHHSAVNDEDLLEVERVANQRIVDNATVHAFETTKEEAEKLGALAFFGDKYGERVRVVEVGDFSREFCGGTHVRSAGQIGPVLVVSEGSIGSNIRRVEALSGSDAYEKALEWRGQLRDIASTLRSPLDGVGDAARSLAQRSKEQEARLAAFEDRDSAAAASSLLEEAEAHGDAKLLVASVVELTPDGLRSLVLQIRERLGTGVAIVGSSLGGKGSLVAVVSPDLVAKGLSAGEIVTLAGAELGGGGSKDPELAQAGGPNGSNLDAALDVARRDAVAALERT
ncbi:MAG: alanine--tRNA ligase [Acidimicrobiia bacterium]|nr:alanine--tRNA ligase [Acidimicrobiia bacterium]